MTIKDIILNKQTVTKPVTSINTELLETFRNMLETMQHFERKYITGPDIGINQRIAVIDGTDKNFNVLMLINPHIVVDAENSVILEYFDPSGKPQSVVLTDVLAERAKIVCKDFVDG